MKFGTLNHPIAGVALPLSALNTTQNCGIGQFTDLVPLAKWCNSVGLPLIQILPVNDSDLEASPYSACSAFALHPVYLDLSLVDGAEVYQDEIDARRRSQQNNQFINFEDSVRFKDQLLRKIYDDRLHIIQQTPEILSWINQNDWIIPFAVFKQLRLNFDFAPWINWPEMWASPSDKNIKKYWNEHQNEAFYYAWTQFEAEKQLANVTDQLSALNVRLKGDIPILMSMESADVWANQQLFNLDLIAGAPPDNYSTTGQNWGLPIYSWDAHEADQFAWWKARLQQAQKFYHAYRIDHVLGFFRIWATPATEKTAMLGFMTPAINLTDDILLSAGFSEEEIFSLSKPWIESNLKSTLNETLVSSLKAVNGHFTIKADLDCETKLSDITNSDEDRETLFDFHHNRALIRLKNGEFAPAWYYQKSTAFQQLNQSKKDKLTALINAAESNSDKMWGKRGHYLLSQLQDASDMLICAEDLGVVPDCLPPVLEDLGMLSLELDRWCRTYSDTEGEYIDVANLNPLSVCSAGGHDTSSLRGWWHDEQEKHLYCDAIGWKGEIPTEITVPFLKAIFHRILGANSKIAMFQIQDYLALSEEYWCQNIDDERINRPGFVIAENWRYKMSATIEKLQKDNGLNDIIFNLILARSKENNILS